MMKERNERKEKRAGRLMRYNYEKANLRKDVDVSTEGEGEGAVGRRRGGYFTLTRSTCREPWMCVTSMYDYAQCLAMHSYAFCPFVPRQGLITYPRNPSLSKARPRVTWTGTLTAKSKVLTWWKKSPN
jgi:hypothetical protein